MTLNELLELVEVFDLLPQEMKLEYLPLFYHICAGSLYALKHGAKEDSDAFVREAAAEYLEQIRAILD